MSAQLRARAALACTIALTGCGGTAGVLAGREALHHAYRHATPKQARVLSGGLCAFHGYRALADLRYSHPGWTAYQLYRGARSCRSAARRTR